MAGRTGTEINVRDLALELFRRGHTPIVYSPHLGEIAHEIRTATVPVVENLSKIGETPDIIHGHHHPVTMQALLHFPDTPAIFYCHDWDAWYDIPLVFPRVYRYIPVDWTVRDRLIYEQGISEAKVMVAYNSVDLRRFQPRDPLPARPSLALIFSRTATEDRVIGAVRSACEAAGVELEVISNAHGQATAEPEKLLPRFDVVFAKARCALESLAVGTAVILCDEAGLGGLVTTGNVDNLRRLNFGRRTLRTPVTAEHVVRELARYDPADATAVSKHIRETAGLVMAVDHLLALYHEVIQEHRHTPQDLTAEGRTASAYLAQWGPSFSPDDLMHWNRKLDIRGPVPNSRIIKENRHATVYKLFQHGRTIIRDILGLS